MSALLHDRSLAGLRLRVTCPCGRALRARLDQAGSEVVCWDCHASVRVPVPAAPGDWVARLLGMGARQIFDAKTSWFLAAGAVIVTLGVLVPGYGVAGAAVALAVVMTGYGELLRRGSQGDWTGRPALGIGMRLWRAMLCIIAAGALVLPLASAAMSGIAPRVTPAGLLIAAVLIATIPLLMLATYGLRGSPRARARSIGSMIVRHPLAVVATLLLLPASLVAIEATMVVVTRINGTFDFLVLDLMPTPASIHPFFGVPFYGPDDYRTIPEATRWSFYFQALGHGHSLVGAIPASLATGIARHFDPTVLFRSPLRYQILRIVFTLLIAAGMLSFLAIQARWLGLLSTMDARRTGA